MICLTLLSAMACGCQTPPRPSTQPAAATKPSTNAPARAAWAHSVAPPPGIDASVIIPQLPLKPQAKMTLEQIVHSLPRPFFMNPPATEPSVQPRGDTSIPLGSQRAYAIGRTSLLNDDPQSAIPQLELALTLAPRSSQIMRLLADAYLRIGNKPRSAYYLEQVLRYEPDDLESLIALGRFSLEEANDNQAILLFYHAADLLKRNRRVSPSLARLIEYYLGSSLEQGGYDQAAIDLLLACLRQGPPTDIQSQADYELSILAREFGGIWQTVGDIYNRLDRPADALAAYNKAMQLGVNDAGGWIARYVYTELRLGHAEAAGARAVEYLQRDQIDPASVKLVQYLVDQGVPGGQLTAALQKAYAESGRPAALAIAIADLLGPGPGVDLLSQHLHSRPGDRLAYEHLIGMIFKAKETPGAMPMDRRAALAVQVTADAIDALPMVAQDYASFLVDAVNNPENAVVTGVKAMPADQQKRPAVRYILAMAYLKLLRFDDAQAVLQATLTDDPNFVAARIKLAQLLVESDQLKQASSVLAPIAERNDPQVIDLRVKILSATDHAAEALQLLDNLIAKDPGGVSLALEKADLLIKMDRATDAERTLLDVLNVHPEAEGVYEMLLEIYEANGVPDATKQRLRLLSRLQDNLPHSRLAQIEMARIEASGGNVDRAEHTLRSLLEANPRDMNVLETLAHLLHKSQKEAEADALIESRLAQMPKDPAMLELASRYYDQYNNVERRNEVRERLYQLIPQGAQRATMLASLYLNWGKFDKAVEVARDALAKSPGDDPVPLVAMEVEGLTSLHRPADARKALTDAIARFPDKETDLNFELAMLEARLHNDKASEEILARNLKKYPNDAKSNNGLGYVWADRGQNLQEAQRMIQLAVNAEPDNAAYLDSLGWVYYKLGKFDDAVRWLTQAISVRGGDNPVIINHLGDAYYRSGNNAQAIRFWRIAQQALQDTPPSDNDPEMEGLPGRLKQKIEAASKNEPAPAASVPESPKTQPQAQ